jgi:cytochrome c nitrite reductase small subunit
LKLTPVFLCVLLGLWCGLGGYTFYYAKGASYLSNDPRACVNCHIMREQYDGWQKASHHAVATCNDCHVPHALIPKYLVKLENGFWHSKGFTLQDFHEPIRMRASSAKVLQNNCLYCHGEFVSQIAVHSGAEQEGVNCTRCHKGVGHGPAIP